MRVLLRDLTPGQDYLMQFRTNNGNDVSEWSRVYTFRTNGDVTPPLPPTNLVWVPTGESFIATWTAPLLDGPDANGVNKELKDFKDFEITVTANGKSKVYYTTDTTWEFTLVMNQQAFGGIELTVKIDVKSRDLTGNKSAAVTKTATEDTPPTPSTPIVTNMMGQINVTWDGSTSLGTINPFNLEYIEIHASPTNNFTPSTTTLVGRFEGWVAGSQKTIITGLTYGTVHYFKLVSVNKKGKKSPASPQAQGTPTRITGLDIDGNAQLSASQMNFTARGLGGANAFYGTVTPTGATAPDGTAYKDGDIFFNTAIPPAANAGKTYRRTGGSFVEDPTIGVISGSKIIANTLTSNAVGTNLLITSKANIGNAVIDDANIANVKAGKIVADDLATNQIISNTAQIKDAIISSAKIINLSANKITTGEIAADQKIIAGPATGTHAEMTSTGFRVFAEDPEDGVPNEVIRLGTDTNDYFGVTSSDGSLVASVDDTGGFNGRTANFKEDIVVGGKTITEQITAAAAGDNQVSWVSAAVINGVTTEIGLFETSVKVKAGNQYLLIPDIPFNRTSTSAELQVRVRDGGTSAPTITSTEIYYRQYNAGNVNWDMCFTQPGSWRPTVSGDHRLLVTAQCAGTGQINVTRISTEPSLFLLDLGPARPILASANRGGGSTAPPTRQYDTGEMGPAGSVTYRGNLTQRTDTTDVVQGYDPSGFNGDGKGYWWFGLPSITGTVDRVDVYLYSNHWYYNSGGTAIINLVAETGGGPNFVKLRGDWHVGGFPKPGGLWLTLPADWWPFFKNGGTNGSNRANGISVGPSGGTNLTYYGRFTGPAARLRIWYTQ